MELFVWNATFKFVFWNTLVTLRIMECKSGPGFQVIDMFIGHI